MTSGAGYFNGQGTFAKQKFPDRFDGTHQPRPAGRPAGARAVSKTVRIWRQSNSDCLRRRTSIKWLHFWDLEFFLKKITSFLIKNEGTPFNDYILGTPNPNDQPGSPYAKYYTLPMLGTPNPNVQAGFLLSMIPWFLMRSLVGLIKYEGTM